MDDHSHLKEWWTPKQKTKTDFTATSITDTLLDLWLRLKQQQQFQEVQKEMKKSFA